MTHINTSDAHIALKQLDDLCQLGVKVDPVGPKRVLGNFLDCVENLNSVDYQLVPTSLVEALTQHFHPDERLSPDRVVAIEALGVLTQRRVGVLIAEPSSLVKLAPERKGSIYVAGPMTGYEDHNFPAFNAAAEILRAEGWKVVNPADHGVVDGAEWGDYLRSDIALLAQCEAIYLLPGWEASKGAQLEVIIATRLGMRFVLADGSKPVESAEQTAAVRDVLAERLRQFTAEGYTNQSDDGYNSPALAKAAGCYILFTDSYPNAAEPPQQWPWCPSYWKPKDYRRDLVRGAALAIAEIERVDRIDHAKQDAEPAFSGDLPDGLTWDQAPYWANVLLSCVREQPYAWAASFTNKARFVYVNEPLRESQLSTTAGSAWKLVASRPQV